MAKMEKNLVLSIRAEFETISTHYNIDSIDPIDSSPAYSTKIPTIFCTMDRPRQATKASTVAQQGTELHDLLYWIALGPYVCGPIRTAREDRSEDSIKRKRSENVREYSWRERTRWSESSTRDGRLRKQANVGFLPRRVFPTDLD